MVVSPSTLLAIAAAAATGVAVGALLVTRLSDPQGVYTYRVKRSSAPKRLILVRHGESQGNIDPLLYCTVPDNAMHLTALGFAQAVAAGQSIKKIIGNESARFIVSPYTRTIETFQGIMKAWGCSSRDMPWHEEPRIREQDFGNFQDPVKIREAKSQRRRFGSFFYRFPSGESPADVYDRISSFLESLYRLFEKTTEENYILVTHGVSIRVILTRYFKYRICEFEQLDNFHNAEFVVLEYDEEQRRFNLGKVVDNKVILNDDGTSTVVETKEYHTLRVHSMEALLSTIAPYPTSPVHHFRRSSSAMFPPAPPQLANETPCTKNEAIPEGDEDEQPLTDDAFEHSDELPRPGSRGFSM